MKLKAPPIEIPTDDPFRNDLLGRKESAEFLTELLRSTDEPMVLCINAPWGEGKSTFLRMWRQTLVNAGFKTLIFNAWENDFSDDALVSLIGELELGIQELSLEKKKAKKATAHINKAKKLGAALLRRSIPSAIKLATAGIVDLEKISEQTLAELGEKLAEEQIKHYEDAKKSVIGFRKELTEFAVEVCNGEGSDLEKKLPLIILIDELDRCRPIYAIEILEKVKHFFSVPRVIFVLAMDKQQLGHSIRSLYGTGMDAGGYLRRFIDMDYNLPSPERGAFSRAQFLRFGLHDFFKKRQVGDTQYDYRRFEELFTELFSALGLTLREQEHSFSLLSLAIRTTPDNYLLFPLLLGTLIILKVKNPDLYKDFITERLNHQDVLRYIGSTPQGVEILRSSYGAVLEAHLLSSRSKRHMASDLVLPYQEVVDNPTSAEPEKERAKRIISILQSFDSREAYGILDYLVGKIDMVSQIKR